MNIALDFIWVLPVAFGVAGAFYCGMQDLVPVRAIAPETTKTKG